MSKDQEVRTLFGRELGATGQVTVAATPAEVYRVVSDPAAMIEFTEELYDVRWLDGATESAVGARFRGRNRNGWRRWATTCRITDLEPDRRFAYEVKALPYVPISRWQYDIEPTDDGCVLTERNWMLAPLWFVPIAVTITGIPDRPAANQTHIATTLNRLKSHLEAADAR